jgi:hypothetical protein
MPLKISAHGNTVAPQENRDTDGLGQQDGRCERALGQERTPRHVVLVPGVAANIDQAERCGLGNQDQQRQAESLSPSTV